MKKIILFLFGLALAFFSADAQVFYVNSNLPPILQADAGIDNFLVVGDSLQIGGESAGLYGYGDYSYLWSPAENLDDPTSANPWAKPEKTTTYILAVSDGHHCLAMDEVIIEVRASGINDPTVPLAVAMYPNPASQYVNITINGFSGDIILTVVNSLGQSVIRKEEHIQEYKNFWFDIRGWNRGLYYVIIQSDQKTYSQVLAIL